VSGLQRSIEAARVAVLARVGVTPHPERVGGSSLVPVGCPSDNDMLMFNEARIVIGDSASTCGPDVMLPPLPTFRPTVPPRPMVRIRAPAPLPEALSWPSGEAVAGSATLSRAAGLVWALLHDLATGTGQARRYAALPTQVVLHLPAGLLALGAGLSRTTLYRALPELVAAGLIAHGGQAQKVNGMGLYGGCLWAVKTTPGGQPPALRREDWKHQHRDFAADIDAGRTVKALVEGLAQLQSENQRESYIGALKAWALSPGHTKPPAVDVGVNLPPADLLELSYRLGDLIHVHPSSRADAVTALSTALSTALNDADSRRWYAGLLWQALEAEHQGRAGLQVLAAQLHRLSADRQEWAGLRNPAALLAYRLTSTQST
jgi:hypothetical protein